MPLTQHELELRKAALERIERGMLPRHIPATVWAGRGSGQPCSLCGLAIGLAEMEYELAGFNASSAAEHTVRFHLRCHALWQLELASLSSPTERAPPRGSP
jgi:hypothetical protein